MPQMHKLSNYRTTWHSDATKGGVTYIQTEIVKWDADTVTLNSGGWRTVTTKRKMCQAGSQFGLGFGVFQRKGEWFVCRHGRSPEGYESACAEHGAVEFPYYDGVTFPRGTIVKDLAA